MIECHCGKCDRLATKNTKLKERVAELEAMVQEFYTPTDRTPKDPAGPMFLLFDSWEEYKEKHIPPATMADAAKAQEDTTAPEWIAQRIEVTASEDGEVNCDQSD